METVGLMKFQLVDKEDDFNNILKVDSKCFSILLYGVMECEWQREILVKPKLRSYITFITRLKKKNIYLRLCRGKHVH